MSRNLVLSGGPGSHRFDATTAALVEIIDPGRARTTVVRNPREFFEELRRPDGAGVAEWDLLVVNALRWQMAVDRYEDQAPRWAFTLEDADAQLLERRIADGAGLLAAHTAVVCFDAHPVWHALLGASWNWDRSHHGPPGRIRVAPTTAGARHPVAAGIAPFAVLDELYEDLDIEADVEVLMTGRQDADPQPLVWTREHGSGRVVVDLLGHDTTSLEDRSHRELLSRAARWAGRREFTGATGK